MNERFFPKIYFAPEGGDGGGGNADTGGSGRTILGGGGGTGGAGSGDTGGQNQQTNFDFRSQLAPEFKDHAALKDIKDLNGLVKTFIHGQSMIGADKVVKPNEKWTEKEWNDFYSQIGRPPTPDDYKLSEVELPNDIKLEPERVKAWNERFHRAGLTNQQADFLRQEFLKEMIDANESVTTDLKKAFDEGMSAIRQEYGDKTDAFIAASAQAVLHFGGEGMVKWLEETGLGNNPNFIKMFGNIGMAMAEHEAKGEGGGAGFNGMTPQNALAEINVLKKDQQFQNILLDRSHKDHKTTLERWNNLHKAAYPNNTPVQ